MKLTQPLHRWRNSVVLVLLVGLVSMGCTMMERMANLGVQTSGETPVASWHTTDLRAYTIAIEEREVYEFTLVLQDRSGRGKQFSHLQATFKNNRHSREFDLDKEGVWKLPARGEVRIPLMSYRYCNTANCRDWGPLAPTWYITLIGQDEQGKPVEMKINLQLPYQDETA